MQFNKYKNVLLIYHFKIYTCYVINAKCRNFVFIRNLRDMRDNNPSQSSHFLKEQKSIEIKLKVKLVSF